MDIVLASSSLEAEVGCWDLNTGTEQIRFRGCGSSPRGLVSVAGRFLASSQLGNTSSSSGSIFYWTWDKPQVEVRSFPAEPILSLVSDPEGNYLLGGGSSGNIYIWEISSGKLLRRWQAHYMAVSCLVFMDHSLVISGSDDGSVRVWNLMSIFGMGENELVKDPFIFSFQEHTLRVTDIVSGYGLCNSIIISSSEDRTCKVWSLAKGRMLRSITFPSIIYAIALDPAESVFYAGCRDGKIYVAALTADHTSNSKYDKYILSCLNEHSKAVTCLKIKKDGLALVSGSEDGTVRVWDIKSQRAIRVLKLNEGPVNNILIVQLPTNLKSTSEETFSSKSQRGMKLRPLDQNIDQTGIPTTIQIFPARNYIAGTDISYCSSSVMMNTIKELQQKSSSSAMEMELDRLREEQRQCSHALQKRKKLFEELWKVQVDMLLDEAQD